MTCFLSVFSTKNGDILYLKHRYHFLQPGHAVFSIREEFVFWMTPDPFLLHLSDCSVSMFMYLKLQHRAVEHFISICKFRVGMECKV